MTIARHSTTERITTMPLIVEDANNQFWCITGDHTPVAWIGYPVKLVRGEWMPKARAKRQLVRKAGCRVVKHNT